MPLNPTPRDSTMKTELQMPGVKQVAWTNILNLDLLVWWFRKKVPNIFPYSLKWWCKTVMNSMVPIESAKNHLKKTTKTLCEKKNSSKNPLNTCCRVQYDAFTLFRVRWQQGMFMADKTLGSLPFYSSDLFHSTRCLKGILLTLYYIIPITMGSIIPILSSNDLYMVFFQVSNTTRNAGLCHGRRTTIFLRGEKKTEMSPCWLSFQLFTPPKTNMTRETSTIWRCISYWTWEFSNVIRNLFAGV